MSFAGQPPGADFGRCSSIQPSGSPSLGKPVNFSVSTWGQITVREGTIWPIVAKRFVNSTVN